MPHVGVNNNHDDDDDGESSFNEMEGKKNQFDKSEKYNQRMRTNAIRNNARGKERESVSLRVTL